MLASANVETWVWVNWSIKYHHTQLADRVAALEKEITDSSDLMEIDILGVERLAIKEFMRLQQQQQPFDVVDFRARYQRQLTNLYKQYNNRTNVNVIPPPYEYFRSQQADVMVGSSAEVKTAEVKTGRGEATDSFESDTQRTIAESLRVAQQRNNAEVKTGRGEAMDSFESDMQRAMVASLYDEQQRTLLDRTRAMFNHHLIGDLCYGGYEEPPVAQRTITYQIDPPRPKPVRHAIPSIVRPVVQPLRPEPVRGASERGVEQQPRPRHVVKENKGYAAVVNRLRSSNRNRPRGKPKQRWRPR